VSGPKSVDVYLAGVPEPSRSALEKLRKQIKQAAPEATETIAYDMPTFRQDGRFLVSFAAYKRHCSLFPASAAVREALGEAIEPYVAGKGTIRFDPKEPLPAALVKRLVQARLEEGNSSER
jgi:uncharacterized protein YdhG (YjbR/CyaY superfamily)